MITIPATRLVYDFDRKYEAILSGRSKEIFLVDKIAYLNEALELWFEKMVDLTDTSPDARHDLRVYRVDEYSLPLLKGPVEGRYYFSYPNNLYQRLNQYIFAHKPECCGDLEKKFSVDIVQSDDLRESLSDQFRYPSFEYEQVLGIDNQDELLVYTEDEFLIKQLRIDYYRRPLPIHAPSLNDQCEPGNFYYDYEGRRITKDQGFESGSRFAHNQITDLAVLCASRDTKDLQGFQTQVNLIMTKKQM